MDPGEKKGDWSDAWLRLRWDMVVALLISAALVAMVWCPGGASGQWAPILIASLVVMAVVAMSLQTVVKGARRGAWDWRWGAPMVALLLLVAVQAVNPSHRFLSDSRALVPQPHTRWLPRSVDGVATLYALAVMAGCAAVFWLARGNLGTGSARRALVLLLVSAGVAMALLVIDQRRTPPPGALYPVTGTFVNSNHFAAYANVLLALALAWAADCWATVRHKGVRVLSSGVFGLAGLVLLYSILRSGSRMGVMVSGLIVVGVTVIAAMRGGTGRRSLLLAAVGLVVLGIVVGVREWRGCEGGWSVRQLAENAAGRLDVQRAALSMIPDRWCAGFGAGTFEEAFPYYQPRTLHGSYRHAHNEYVQYLVELGVLGVALSLWLVVAACGVPVRDAKWQPLSPWERAGTGLALTALALHAMVDFPFRHPAIGMLASVVVGMSGGQIARGCLRGGTE